MRISDWSSDVCSSDLNEMASKTMRSMRTPMARVRGLGSAKAGVHHWWAQRLTAIALVPLTLWFVVSVAGMPGMDHATAVAWIGSPPVAEIGRASCRDRVCQYV